MKLRRLLIGLLLLATTLGCAGLFLISMPKVKLGQQHGEQFTELASKISVEGADLLVATAPYRQRRWRATEGAFKKIRRRLATIAFHFGLDQSDAEHLDLRTSFAKVVEDDRNFRDPVHLSEIGSPIFGSAVLQQLHTYHQQLGQPYPKKVVIVGDCYSEDLVSALEIEDPETSYLAARSYADANGAIELVFKFKESYLSETDLVIWLRPEIFLVYNNPPELDLAPLKTGGTVTQMTATATSDLGYGSPDFHKIKPDLEYPNAAVEIAATDPEGNKIVLCAYAARDREPTGFEAIKAGDALVLTAQPLDSYLAENPKEAGAYYFRREDDILAPRYWVHEWAKTDYTGKKAVSKSGARD